ncbi:DNA internalization-related competence protein ComEC/Rec2 [Halobacillus locisalis]|uniref:DNA internalization-related competence protein ComEC/Rec2 n=2 Tax=Halobacillus locisalis TaxID=220753 RepID=A0A838CMT5_9BACI|nr:DNA internalization-related competence protein ComEC/Rec2 [Halobacillus locisalis]
MFFLILLFFLFGYVYLSPPTSPSILPTHLSSTVVIKDLEYTSQTVQLVVYDTQTKDHRLITYFGKESSALPVSWKHGATCAVGGEVKPIDGATNPGEFDYRQFMARQSVHGQVELSSPNQLKCEGHSKITHLYEARVALMKKVEGALSKEAFAWVAALVFGEQDHLEEGTVQWFRDFNLSHILAISGLHVGLFITGVYLLIYRLGIGTKEQAKVLLFLMLPMYAFLAGAAPSVLRASLMAVCVLLLPYFRLKVPLTDIVSFIALGLLIVSPSYFSQIGFQFSFLVTFSLILSFSVFSNSPNVWVTSAQISLISQLSILPIQIHYFYEFNPLSLVANVLLVPYFSFVVIPFSIVLVITSLMVPAVSLFLSASLSQSNALVLQFFEWGLEPLRISWVVGEMSPFYMILSLGAFICMMAMWSQNRLRETIVAGTGMVVIISLFSMLPYFSSKGTVTMLDIGQGDTFVIELPYRKGVIIVDAAGPPIFTENKRKTADRIILPFLKSRGIDTIDALIVSHEDSDHNGSVPYLIEELNVEALVVSSFYDEEETGVKVARMEAGDVVEIKDHRFEILHPYEDTQDSNDNSLVLTSAFGGKKWMFTGDISKEMEAQIMERYPSLDIDILKIGHHGSDTSTSEEWVTMLNPSVALISAGRNNRYGHPHADVLKRLERNHSTIYVTSEHGSVQYTFSGQSGTFSSFLSYNANRSKEKRAN